ncbi:Hypothetical predicted protein [Podarcis lilfordi]|uniref:Uncharacterized protein n=1 Tax=Podarcis lilfordi TaxID=74358 RepID=A0AA35LGZ4_9SAUR|nr:Hypothetical predicted protein [Podarcis lilfordi]
MATELKVRASKNEVVRLEAVLEEENCLESALAEKQTLKAKLDEGAESNKDEIEDLKTWLAKADMARMKQCKYFDRELANAKALAEHREEKVRKQKLHRVQQEQEVTADTKSLGVQSTDKAAETTKKTIKHWLAEDSYKDVSECMTQ